jgi:hypothetical protein
LVKTLGLSQRLFFGKAVAVTQIFDMVASGAIQKVLGPHIASLKRSGENFLLFYKTATTLFTSLALRFYAFVALNSYNIILVLFGQQWVFFR